MKMLNYNKLNKILFSAVLIFAMMGCFNRHVVNKNVLPFNSAFFYTVDEKSEENKQIQDISSNINFLLSHSSKFGIGQEKDKPKDVAMGKCINNDGEYYFILSYNGVPDEGENDTFYLCLILQDNPSSTYSYRINESGKALAEKIVIEFNLLH